MTYAVLVQLLILQFVLMQVTFRLWKKPMTLDRGIAAVTLPALVPVVGTLLFPDPQGSFFFPTTQGLLGTEILGITVATVTYKFRESRAARFLADQWLVMLAIFEGVNLVDFYIGPSVFKQFPHQFMIVGACVMFTILVLQHRATKGFALLTGMALPAIALVIFGSDYVWQPVVFGVLLALFPDVISQKALLMPYIWHRIWQFLFFASFTSALVGYKFTGVLWCLIIGLLFAGVFAWRYTKSHTPNTTPARAT